MTKSKKTSTSRRLIWGLIALITIFLLFGMYTIYDVHRVSHLSRTIFNHPLVVSNAALQANASIAKMHRSMKDVVLFDSPSRVQQSIDEVNEIEGQVYRQLNMIKNKILGEEGKVLENIARKLFDDWRPIRNEVIELVHNGQTDLAAEITIKKGADHVALLEIKMLGLTSYARNKASEFNNDVESAHLRLTVGLVSMLVLGVFASLLVAFFTLKRTLLTEKALQKSEARYRSLIESQTDLICRFTPLGKFTFVNTIYCQLLNKSNNELIGSKWQLLSVDDNTEIIEEKLLEMSSSNPIFIIENRVLSGKGDIHWVQFINQGFFDHQGNLQEIQSVGRDITERKKIELALQERTETLRQAQRVGKIGSWWYDPETQIPTWTEEMFHIFGLEPEQEAIPYEDHRDIIHPEDWDRFNAAVTRSVSEGIGYNLELRTMQPRGEIRYIHSKCIVKKNAKGAVIQLIGTTQDITERKQSEKYLQESEELLRTLINTIPDLIWLKDPDGVYITCNKQFELMFGAKKSEIIGKTDYDFVDKELADFFRKNDKKAIDAGFPSTNEEELTFATDGYHGLFETIKTPMHLADGKLVGVLGIARDITELKKTKSELEVKSQQLIQAQKMESIGNLAGGVAHDYNNLSSIIIGYTELALEQVKQNDPLHEDLTEILTAAKRSTDITQQLLAFARKQTISPRVLDLNDTIESMLKMFQRLIGENIDVVWLPETELWPVKMDPSQMGQIIANLAVNARDAISDVGKVVIETNNISFNEEYCNDHLGFVPGEYVMLAVSDDGSGIAPDILDRIFEPFFTTKGQGKGTGLGLSTIYGIVKQNNGFINVYSELKKGTTIKIYLSRHEGQVVQSQSDNNIEMPISRGETVLLVEDDGSILKFGKRILEELGYTVLSASSPGEATRLAEDQAGEIDILITDVIMPEMNGRELSEYLQSLYPDLKILFMSGYTANVIAHRGVLDNDVCFMSKPFSKKEMAGKVRKLLDEA